MAEPWCDGISPGQEDRIKRAVESTCELCREYLPGHLLTLHGLLPGPQEADPNPKEREQNILVVCEPCHRLIHEETVPVQKLRALLKRRTFTVRREILAALGYVPKSIIPPEGQDFAQIYDDTIRDFSGHYR